MRSTEEELQAVKLMWAEDEEDRRRRQEAARAEKLQMRRDHLLSGQWRPQHRCDRCIIAILEMDPSGVCAEGMQHGEHWWK
jgi:hypothetical protein